MGSKASGTNATVSASEGVTALDEPTGVKAEATGVYAGGGAGMAGCTGANGGGATAGVMTGAAATGTLVPHPPQNKAVAFKSPPH